MKASRHWTVSIVWGLLALSFIFCAPFTAQAKMLYTRSQARAILAHERARLVKTRLRGNVLLRNYRRAIIIQRARLKRGKCERRRVLVPPIPKRYDTWCFRLYRGREAVFVNGRHKPVLSVGHAAVAGLKRGFEKLKRDVNRNVRRFSNDISRTTQKVTNDTKRFFDRKIAEIKRKAKVEAKKLVNQPAWRKKIMTKIAGLAVSKGPTALKMASGKLSAKLRDILRNHRNLQNAKRALRAAGIGKRSMKIYAKSALISVGIAVGFQGLTIAIDCWKYTGAKKRVCLTNATAKGMRDLSFSVLAALVAVGIDVSVIDPLSALLASAVGAALAAATVGVGAAAIPIIYIASSIALNLAVFSVLEFLVRKQYNKLFQRFLGSHIRKFSVRFIRSLPNEMMVCWGTNGMCEGNASGPKPAPKPKRCPRGTEKDANNRCWRCPHGFRRNGGPHTNPRACVRRGFSRARYHRRGGLLVNRCPRGTFFDMYRGGGCWSCPRGTRRSVHPVFSSRACSGTFYRRTSYAGMAR